MIDYIVADSKSIFPIPKHPFIYPLLDNIAHIIRTKPPPTIKCRRLIPIFSIWTQMTLYLR